MNFKNWILLIFLIFGCLVHVGDLSAQTSRRGKIWVGATDDNSNPRWATQADFDGSGLVFCRGYYEQNKYPYGWYVDYPGLDYNFLIRLSELTKVNVNFDSNNEPVHVVVKLDSPLLFECPVLFMSDVGTIEFKESEVKNLSLYFKKGGFLWVDDFWGSAEWARWEYQIGRVLYSSIYPIEDIPKDHPIMHQFFDIKEIPQISHMGFWYKMSTSERGEDSKDVHFRGISGEKGRLMVVITHNTDIGESIEREAYNVNGSFRRFSPVGYSIAINIFIYALTH